LQKVITAYRQVYDSLHPQADCQEPGSAPEHYARKLSMGYLYLYVNYRLSRTIIVKMQKIAKTLLKCKAEYLAKFDVLQLQCYPALYFSRISSHFLHFHNNSFASLQNYKHETRAITFKIVV